MNIEFLRQYADNQFAGMQGLPADEAGTEVLRLADYLLEQLEQEPEVFAAADEKSLHRAFLQCSKAARRLSGFAEQYGGGAPERSRKALDTIRDSAARIDAMQEQTRELLAAQEELRTVHAQLLANQSALEQQKQALDDLRQTVAHLTALRECILRAGEEMDELRALADANRTIADAIAQSGYVADGDGADSFRGRAEALSRQAQAVTEDYNAFLGAVLEDARALQRQTQQRQEPGA